jgi:hypothetical protein
MFVGDKARVGAEGELMAEGNQQQQQQDPAQRLATALSNIRRVQNYVELQAPAQGDMIRMLRQAGDLVWGEIERIQQVRQQQQQQQQQQGR